MKVSVDDAPNSSQEVRDNLANRDGARRVFCGVEDFEVALHVFANVQDRGNVTATVAVVWCRPHRHEIGVLEPVFKAIHHKLMSPGHKLEVVDMVEFGSNLGTEEPAGTTWGDSPGVYVFGIGPHEVGEGTLVRNFHSSINEADLV